MTEMVWNSGPSIIHEKRDVLLGSVPSPLDEARQNWTLVMTKHLFGVFGSSVHNYYDWMITK